MSAPENNETETLKLIKDGCRPPRLQQLLTGRRPTGSAEAPAATRQRLEVPLLLRLCVTEAALQKDGQNPLETDGCCCLKAALIAGGLNQENQT